MHGPYRNFRQKLSEFSRFFLEFLAAIAISLRALIFFLYLNSLNLR